VTDSTAPSSGPASTPPARQRLPVHALTTGHVRVRQSQVCGVGTGNARRLNVLRDKQWTDPLPIHAWAIEHPEGVIVVDTGEVAAGSDPHHYPALNPYLRRATRFDIAREDEIDAQLRRAGLAMEQVRWVVLTHLHTDHAGGLGFFRDAEVIMSREEWDAARGIRGRGRGYGTSASSRPCTCPPTTRGPPSGSPRRRSSPPDLPAARAAGLSHAPGAIDRFGRRWQGGEAGRTWSVGGGNLHHELLKRCSGGLTPWLRGLPGPRGLPRRT
jgi:metallo-beta-lactamase superfamily protein